MNELLAMRENRAKLWETMKNFLDTHKDAKGLMNAEDSATYDKMEKDLDSYGAQIVRLENAARIESDMARPADKPLIGASVDTAKPAVKATATKEYENALFDALRNRFRNTASILQEGVDADGGYLVPEEMDKRLIEKLNEENIMRRLSTVIRTSGDHKINISTDKPAAAWLDEGGALSFDDAKFAQEKLDAHKLAVAIKITEELLYDSMFNMRSFITQKFASALANAEEEAFLTGDGEGKPKGVFVMGTQLTAAATLTSNTVFDAIYALKRPYRKNAKFIMNDKTIAAIRKLKDNNGAYIWQPSYVAGEPDRIGGYVVETSAYAPESKIAFGDFSYYNIGDRGSRTFQELRELYAGNGMVGFVAKERVDGKLLLAEAVQILPITSLS